MFGVIGRVKNQSGFSMAEVVMAALLFTASVLGISSMLVSGGANITRGATETSAANIASRRIEEVRSLPFYRPWDADIGNQDIDDFYYNPAMVNGYGGSVSQEALHPQLDNPVVVEDYGTIPGSTQFKRTTAVEYQYVSTLGGTSHLAPAVMCTTSPFYYVPKSPQTGQTDVARGGATAAVKDELHAIVVEVCVYYSAGGGERVFKERSLIGDLTTTGSTNVPFLLITSVAPMEGAYLDPHANVTIYVKATVPPFGPSSQVDVRLWRTGCTDLVAHNVQVGDDGTYITCYFDLSDSDKVKVGIPYSVSVYWKDGGWTDVLRDCYVVTQEAPVITGIRDFDWAHSQQTARQVTIEGNNLQRATSVKLRGPNPDNTYEIGGSIVRNEDDENYIVANFNIASTETTPDSRWNVVVVSGGGAATSSSDETRVRMNPPPNITSVTETSPGNYYKWAYRSQTTRKVRVEGEYLYGLGTTGDPGLDIGNATLSHGEYETLGANLATGANPAVNDWQKDTPAVIDFNPRSSGAPIVDDANNNKYWKVTVTNMGGEVESGDPDIERVLMNPPITVTGFTGAPSPAKTGSAANPSKSYTGMALTGSYLQDASSVYLVRTSGGPPVDGQTYVKLGGGATADGSSISGLTMDVSVNPATATSFNQWPVSTGAENALTAGTYYVYCKAPDGQTGMPSATVTVNHAQYTVTVARKQTWGTVSPAGANTCWQDQSVSISASASDPVVFVDWQKGGSDLGWPSSKTFTATETTTYTARFRKKLYWDGTNHASFVPGYTDSPCGGSVSGNLYQHAWTSWFDTGEYANVTTGTVDFTGATTLYITWTQSNGGGSNSFFVVSSNKTANSGTYDRRVSIIGSFGWRDDSIAVGDYASTPKYVRVHATNDWLSESQVSASRIWLE